MKKLALFIFLATFFLVYGFTTKKDVSYKSKYQCSAPFQELYEIYFNKSYFKSNEVKSVTKLFFRNHTYFNDQWGRKTAVYKEKNKSKYFNKYFYNKEGLLTKIDYDHGFRDFEYKDSSVVKTVWQIGEWINVIETQFEDGKVVGLLKYRKKKGLFKKKIVAEEYVLQNHAHDYYILKDKKHQTQLYYDKYDRLIKLVKSDTITHNNNIRKRNKIRKDLKPMPILDLSWSYMDSLTYDTVNSNTVISYFASNMSREKMNLVRQITTNKHNQILEIKTWEDPMLFQGELMEHRTFTYNKIFTLIKEEDLINDKTINYEVNEDLFPIKELQINEEGDTTKTYYIEHEFYLEE